MSRYTMAEKIKRKTAKETQKALCRQFQSLPVHARRSITADNGTEFTQHTMMTKRLGVLVYFADPYASYQRGTNENGNGIIRRFFPKKTNFDCVSHKQLQAVIDWMNHRPMKCLSFKTPHEVFHEQLLLCQKSKTGT